MLRYVLLALSLLFAGSLGQASPENGPTPSPQNAPVTSHQFPAGDPRICMQVSRLAKFPLKRFSALPGMGWDNLQNSPSGQIINYNFTKCKMTDDGVFLIPDAIFTIPVKASLVQTFAEVYNSWNNVTSVTSRTINVDAGLKFASVGISGSYSNEHTRMKQKLIQDNSVATRVQLRYIRYKAILQPGSELYPDFRERILSIAADFNANLTESAYYKCQLLVRDYGTHVLSSVTAGAALVKTDFISRSYVATKESDKRVITASASASFGDVFKFGSSFKETSELSVDAGYKQSMTHSYVTTYGGPIFRPYNMSVSEWVEGVDSDMVAMDRTGDPLFFVINPDLFPNLPSPILLQVQENIRMAIEQYYEMNTIRGCTKRGSPNFSYLANVDDDSCVEPRMNLTFGGVYQTCTVSGRSLSGSPCDGLSVVNPLTKGMSCPRNYISIQLHAGIKKGPVQSDQSCRRCGFLKLRKCCHTNNYQATAHYATFWCAATGPVPDQSGYLFGGIWSSTATNLVTKTKGCPPNFYRLSILQEHHICLSDDYELAKDSAVPFGGFTSCSAGNPLAVGSQDDSQENSLRGYISLSEAWPKRCPRGFSQHMAAIDDGCEIRYCIRTGALTGPILPPIRQPPYSSKPAAIRQTDVYTIINSDTSIPMSGMVVSKVDYDKAMNGESSSGKCGAHGTYSLSLIVMGIAIVTPIIWTREHELWARFFG